MKNNFSVLWFTGMSGSGKSTLALYISEFLLMHGYKTRIIDGDDMRDGDEKKLGFGFEDVQKNNLRIAEFCLDLKNKNFDIVIVPVISPYNNVRKKVEALLSPFLQLIYIKSDISTLKDRDTKGLYASADRGDISDLIGYSNEHPYDEPTEPSVVINTGSKITLGESKNKLLEYVKTHVINM